MDDCAYGTDYPSSYGTGASFFLFETREDCCEKWECPATTLPATTAAATTEAAITTAAAATEGPDTVEDDVPGTVYHPCAVGPDAEPCLKGEVCAVSDAETCAGICLPAPQAMCPYTYQPVCGCGEVEYSNACMAGLDGNAVKHWGKCGGPVLDGSGIDIGDDAPATTGAPVTEAPVTTDAPATTTESPATTTGLPLPAMYHPDLSAHDSGRVPCVYSNDYPGWYLDAENYQSHLFATEAECCGVHNCLSNYPDMWYPTVVMGDGDGDGVNDEDGIVCVYENMYPTDWLGEEGYLFKTEADCYARHGEGEFVSSLSIRAGALCLFAHFNFAIPFSLNLEITCVNIFLPRTDPAGREFWYPELVDGLKSCVYGSSYLPGWYVNPATRSDWLFASEGECCDFHSCDDDPDSSAEEKAEHWHPDFDSYEHGAGDKIRCASSSAYPDFFAMDGIEPRHLFDDEASCCAVWDCGLDLERFWYPDLNEEEATGAATCLYGNAYPLPFLADPENHLFADEGSCLTRGDATAAPSYYYPAVVDGVRECPYGSDYDPAYSSFPGLLFDDHASCCEAHSACPTLRSGAEEVWWPDLAGFETTGRIDCVFSGEYPEYYTEIPEGHLYGDRESCCGDHPCPTNFADRWYLVVDGTSMTCRHDNSYPLEHLASSAMYLFSSEDACLALWGGADVPDAPATTAAPLLGDGTPATMPLPGDDATTDAPAIGANPDDSPEEEQEDMMWFPDITGEGNSCAHGVPEAGMFVVSQGFVYGTEAECCEAHSCDDFVDDPTTTAAATVAATTTEAATVSSSSFRSNCVHFFSLTNPRSLSLPSPLLPGRAVPRPDSAAHAPPGRAGGAVLAGLRRRRRDVQPQRRQAVVLLRRRGRLRVIRDEGRVLPVLPVPRRSHLPRVEAPARVLRRARRPGPLQVRRGLPPLLHVEPAELLHPPLRQHARLLRGDGARLHVQPDARPDGRADPGPHAESHGGADAGAHRPDRGPERGAHGHELLVRRHPRDRRRLRVRDRVRGLDGRPDLLGRAALRRQGRLLLDALPRQRVRRRRRPVRGRRPGGHGDVHRGGLRRRHGNAPVGARRDDHARRRLGRVLARLAPPRGLPLAEERRPQLDAVEKLGHIPPGRLVPGRLPRVLLQGRRVVAVRPARGPPQRRGEVREDVRDAVERAGSLGQVPDGRAGGRRAGHGVGGVVPRVGGGGLRREGSGEGRHWVRLHRRPNLHSVQLEITQAEPVRLVLQ